MTINEPISPGARLDGGAVLKNVMELFVGPLEHNIPPDEGLLFYAGGRMYMNLSNLLWLASPLLMAWLPHVRGLHPAVAHALERLPVTVNVREVV